VDPNIAAGRPATESPQELSYRESSEGDSALRCVGRETRKAASRLDRSSGQVHYACVMGYHLRAEAAAGPRAEGRAARVVRTRRAGVGSGYRYYSPELGRWVNRDPIGERGGKNLYMALANDGMSNHDILGLSLLEKGKGYLDAFQAASHAWELWRSHQFGSLDDILVGGEELHDFDRSSWHMSACPTINERRRHEYCPGLWHVSPDDSPEVRRRAKFNPGSGDSSDGWIFFYTETTSREYMYCVIEECLCIRSSRDPARCVWACSYSGPGTRLSRTRTRRRWSATGNVNVTPPSE